MSGGTTPRPWRLEISGIGACGDPECCSDYEEYASISDADDAPVFPSDLDAAELIVRAVNQHDALMEFASAVRSAAWTSESWPRLEGDGAQEVYVAIRDLDAKIGGQDD